MRHQHHIRLATLGVATALLASFTGCTEPTESATPSGVRSTGSNQPLRDTTSDRTATADRKAADQGMLSEAMAYPTGDRKTSAILLEKSAPSQIRAGQPYQYQLKVTNLTDAPLGGVAIREQTGEGFSVTESSIKPAQQDGQNVYTVGELTPRESKVISVTGTAAAEAKQVSSCTSITYNPTLCTVATVIAPKIGITKAVPEQADICQDIVYRYTITNTGSGTETDVRVEDKLPEGLVTADGKNVVSFVVDQVPQGKSREFEVQLKAQKTGEFASQASATSAGGTVQSEKMSTKVIAPELKLALKGPEKEYIGKGVTYDLSVQNTGASPASDATIAFDGLGRGAALAAVEAPAAGEGEAQLASGRMDGSAATAIDVRDGKLGTIEPGQTRHYRLTVPADEPGTVNVKAIAKARCATDATATASTKVEAIAALLLEVLDRQDPVRVNENVTYTIRVLNQGSGPDTNIGVTATLPEQLQYVSSTGASQATADGQTITFAAVPTLGAGKTVEWTLDAKAVKPGDVRFKLNMKSDSLGEQVAETESTRLY